MAAADIFSSPILRLFQILLSKVAFLIHMHDISLLCYDGFYWEQITKLVSVKNDPIIIKNVVPYIFEMSIWMYLERGEESFFFV